MKQIILFILSIVILVVLKFIFFSNSEKKIITTQKEATVEPLNNKVTEEKVSTAIEVPALSSTPIDEKLNNELKMLFKKAENFLQKSQDEEAIKIYNLILKKANNSTDPTILKHFVSACMSKGYIYQIYPNRDQEEAITAYRLIIDKFEKNTDRESIQYYIDAQQQLSYLLPTDERAEIYSELISKFENSTDKEIQKRIESLLISKSFQLMGENDEEAMQILDKVIEKYKEKDATANLPENIRFSILNNIELALITNNENDTYVELAQKFMSNSPDTKPLLDMLNIIKNAQDLNQDDALQTWKEKYKDYHFPDWSFQELERWAYRMEDKETKERVSKYINAFVDQKYNIENKNRENNNYEYTPKNHNNNIYEDSNLEEENNYNDDEAIEEEVYENDIPENNEEELYPNPYGKEVYDEREEYSNPYE